MAKQNTELNRETIINLVRTSSMLTRLSHRFFNKFGINDGQFNILMVLKRESEGLSQAAIGNELIVAKPNLVGMLDKLEELEYISRVVNKGDRRANLITITKSGRKFLEEIETEYISKINDLMSILNDAQKKDLVTSMEKLRTAIGEG
jgi:DNA-binding MarR family transcriptional regulator